MKLCFSKSQMEFVYMCVHEGAWMSLYVCMCVHVSVCVCMLMSMRVSVCICVCEHVFMNV